MILKLFQPTKNSLIVIKIAITTSNDAMHYECNKRLTFSGNKISECNKS